MTLLDLAYAPPALVSVDDTVRDAVAEAVASNSDAVIVQDNGRMVGVLTSYDVMLKVVLKRLDVESALAGEIMTAPVVTFQPDRTYQDALEMMLAHHFRHLVLSQDGVTPEGILSLRRLLNHIVRDQRDDLRHLEAFLNADGPGG